MCYLRSLLAVVAFSPLCFGQQLILTAEGRNGTAPPELSKSDISVEINKRPVPIQTWIPLRGDSAALQLYIVIDDGENADLSNQFRSLKAFIRKLPASTAVGLAYLRNGEALIAAPLSNDHEAAAGSFRLPLGERGISGSPYISLSALIKKWPAAPGIQREVLLISSGLDPYSPADPLNPYLENAIADAQRAGIPIHSIYYGGSGHFGRLNWGVNYLAELGDATGGKAYWQGFGSPVLFDGFLKDLSLRLQNQYLLTVAPEDTKTGLEPVRVTTSKPAVSLSAPGQIFMIHPAD